MFGNGSQWVGVAALFAITGKLDLLRWTPAFASVLCTQCHFQLANRAVGGALDVHQLLLQRLDGEAHFFATNASTKRLVLLLHARDLYLALDILARAHTTDIMSRITRAAHTSVYSRTPSCVGPRL